MAKPTKKMTQFYFGTVVCVVMRIRVFGIHHENGGRKLRYCPPEKFKKDEFVT